MRRKLTPEEVDNIRKENNLEDVPEEDAFLQYLIKEQEEFIYNDTSCITKAEIGERLWTVLPTHQLVQCTVLEEEPTFPVEYKVKLDTQDEPISLSHTLLFKEQRACALNELHHIVHEYARAENWLMESFTGVHYERWTCNDKDTPSRFKEGDEIWFREPHNDNEIQKGIITGIEKETDEFDAPFMPYTYYVKSRDENKGITCCQELTDENVYATRAECIMAIMEDRQMCAVMADIETFKMLTGTEEANQQPDTPPEQEEQSES